MTDELASTPTVSGSPLIEKTCSRNEQEQVQVKKEVQAIADLLGNRLTTSQPESDAVKPIKEEEDAQALTGASPVGDPYFIDLTASDDELVCPLQVDANEVIPPEAPVTTTHTLVINPKQNELVACSSKRAATIDDGSGEAAKRPRLDETCVPQESVWHPKETVVEEHCPTVTTDNDKSMDVDLTTSTEQGSISNSQVHDHPVEGGLDAGIDQDALRSDELLMKVFYREVDAGHSCRLCMYVFPYCALHRAHIRSLQDWSS